MATLSRFAEVLEAFVRRSGYTPGQLQDLSGIPRRTIANWLEGRVQKPRQYTDLLKLGAALRLEETEANQLLFLTGYPSIGTLLTQADDEESQALLLPWKKSIRLQMDYSPFQVIPDLPYFVGRTAELQWLQDKILESKEPRIFCLQGMGGVGKTTLAVKVAYLLRSYFPDGVLWARLDTTDIMATLHSFAQAYGRNIDKGLDLDSRSRILREILADKRTLILLDNAESSYQITPFLPPSLSKCAVIITTRRRDLDATVGAALFSVEPFGADESLQLFSRLVGEAKIKQQSSQFAELAILLGHLPLAMSIMASRLAYEPNEEVGILLEGLHSRQTDIAELSSESLSVNQSFLLSYAALPAEQQHFFTSLGVFASEDFSIKASAYVSNLSEEKARDHLRKLYALSLVQMREPGRYALHPLVQLFVFQKLEDEMVFNRFSEYFVQFVETQQKESELIKQEFENIVSALKISFKTGEFTKSIRGVLAFVPYLTGIGFYTEARNYLQLARKVSEQIDDNKILSVIWHQLGKIARKQGRYEEALSCAEKSLEIQRQNQPRLDSSGILHELGTIFIHQGQYERAKAYLGQCLAMAEAHDNLFVACDAQATFGILYARLGQVSAATANFQRALNQARQLEDRERICRLLNNLGALCRRLGDVEQAEVYFEESLLLSRQLNHWEHTTVCLNNLALLAQQQHNHAKAEELINEAVHIARRIGFRLGLVQSVLNLGMLEHARENYGRALNNLLDGLQLARELKHPWYLAFALNELGILYMDTAKQDAALEIFQEAQQIAVKISAAELQAKALFGLARVNAFQGLKTKAKVFAEESIAQYQSASLTQESEQVRDWLHKLDEEIMVN